MYLLPQHASKINPPTGRIFIAWNGKLAITDGGIPCPVTARDLARLPRPIRRIDSFRDCGA